MTAETNDSIAALRTQVRATRADPAPVCFVIDNSASLKGMYGLTGLTKAQAVHQATDRLVHALADSSIEGSDLVQRFSVRLLTFATDAQPLDPKHPGWRSIEDIAKHPYSVDSDDFPVNYIPPLEPNGRTNAKAGADLVLEDFRPEGMYITIWDGGWTGEDPGESMKRIRDGAHSSHVLITGSECAPEVIFPTSTDDLPQTKQARELFEWSSPLSIQEIEQAREFGLDARPGSRSMILNASPEVLLAFIDMATRSVEDTFFGRDLSLGESR
ncbi:MAG: hypothetical protein JKY61_06280 [Planctomycetes bacterium]|nr:hypothetical protein [Planctomycetota bacterium]